MAAAFPAAFSFADFSIPTVSRLKRPSDGDDRTEGLMFLWHLAFEQQNEKQSEEGDSAADQEQDFLP
ncbi:MAG: hypothetical protein MZV70_39215 [Desulfobacterales bacterium]|nr:hypothetical protein [Desulfobacterales bacterium]